MTATATASALTGSNLVELARRAADAAETAGGDLLTITMGQMGDGSGRAYALLTIYACGVENEYRVTTPAPTGCPQWASHFDWSTELNAGDQWINLDGDEA